MLSERTTAYLIVLFIFLALLSFSGKSDYTPPPRVTRTTTSQSFQQEYRDALEQTKHIGAYPLNLPLPGGGTFGNLGYIVPDK